MAYTRRDVLKTALAGAGTAAAVTFLPRGLKADAVSTTPLHGVNYFPAAHGGFNMWTNYSEAVTWADAAVVRGLGFNMMRVQISAGNGAFSMPTPTTAQLENLQRFYKAVKHAGVNMHLTFFDMFGGIWGHIGKCEAWLTAIIGALRAVDPTLSHVRILETHNEVWTSANANQTYGGGFDSGWPSGVAKPSQTWQVALVWVQYMTYKLRALAPGIPLTTSVPSGQGTATTGLGLYYRASHGTDWQPDWYDYHCYGGQNSIASQLHTALNVVGGDPAMLHVGEFGMGTNSMSISQSERQACANYMQNVRYYCHKLGLAAPEPWILHDIKPCGEFSTGQSFGLLTTSGALTPAGELYKKYPPSTVPPVLG